MMRDMGTIPGELSRRIILDRVHPLTAWREHRGLTKAQLARKAEVSHSYVSQIEAGKRDGSVKVLLALAQALDTDIEFLVIRPAD